MRFCLPVGRRLLPIGMLVFLGATAALASPRYQTRVTAPGSTPQAPTAQPLTLQGEDLRATPGALGDPFRILSLLPGVATPLPMLPMFSVRGASPGMTGFFIDGLRVPQLFHLLVGGGVVHAGIIDKLDFFAGGYDVTFGRFASGIATATTRPAGPSDGRRVHVEGELRLLDLSALVELRLPGSIRVSASGHFGYPGPLLHAIDNRIDLSYWDYQLRLDWRGLTVQALGSYDSLRLDSRLLRGSFSSPNVRTAFHRAQIRLHTQRERLSAELALHGGLDEVGTLNDSGVRKRSIGARANLWLRAARLSLYAAVDGELASFQADRIQLPSLNAVGAPSYRRSAGWGGSREDELGELGDDRVGMTASAALQATAVLWPQRLTLTAGGRVDLYRAGAFTTVGFDPRAQLRLSLTDWLDVQLAGGVYQQPPSFPVQLPGIDTFALQLGLQRATHASVAETLRLPLGLALTATGYYQRFARVTDVPPLGAQMCAPPPSDQLTGTTAELLRVVDGDAMGLEVLLRRQSGRVTGWVAYTLSRAERAMPCGLRPADYDQTHVLNVVAQVRLPRAVRLGARVYVATGRPETVPTWPDYASTLRNNVRLPTYAQLDVRLDKEWRLRHAALLFTLEVVNATFSESVLALSFPERPDSPLGIDPTQPQSVGFRWLLPSIGLRATY